MKRGNLAMAHTVQSELSAAVDAEYHFGRPHVYLTPQEIARLLIARSRLGDTRADRAAEPIEPAYSIRPRRPLHA
jgi:hypothetical protein